MSTILSYADITWSDDFSQITSNTYDDIYYMPGQGIDEAMYVFLQGNNLPNQWHNKKYFSIAETGFGTGLNFFLTWQLWEKKARPKTHLHYLSFEKNLIHPEHLETLYPIEHPFHAMAQQIKASYPLPIEGIHRIQCTDQITLDLIIGDMNEMLPQLDASIDSWFLDGFSPDKNPDMWSDTLWQHMKRLTKPTGTCATFTAAGHVKRGLISAGFEIEKRKGFGKKRHMLTGTFIAEKEVLTEAPLKEEPWFSMTPISVPKEQHAIIIGGGIAGTSCAHALARYGWDITLIEQKETLAAGASGNPRAILMPMLTASSDIGGQCHRASYHYTMRQMEQFYAEGNAIEFDPSGALLLCSDEAQYARYLKNLNDHPLHLTKQAIPVNANEASEKAGIALSLPGIWFPTAGSLSPFSLCHYYIERYKERISVHLNTTITHIAYEKDQWCVFNSTGREIARAPTLILTSTYETTNFTETEWIPIRKIRGQISKIKENNISRNLQTILCSDRYIIPSQDGIHTIGASFITDNDDVKEKEEENQENIYYISNLLETPITINDVTKGRVSIRAGSPDRRPIVGPIANKQWFEEHYAHVHFGQKEKILPYGQYLPGLYTSIGHGSRGFVTAPFSAEILASDITGLPCPATQSVRQALNPSRFITRNIKRIKNNTLK